MLPVVAIVSLSLGTVSIPFQKIIETLVYAFSGNAEIGERLISKKTGFSENMASINL